MLCKMSLKPPRKAGALRYKTVRRATLTDTQSQSTKIDAIGIGVPIVIRRIHSDDVHKLQLVWFLTLVRC